MIHFVIGKFIVTNFAFFYALPSQNYLRTGFLWLLLGRHREEKMDEMDGVANWLIMNDKTNKSDKQWNKLLYFL